jgi:hypothetical protein
MIQRPHHAMVDHHIADLRRLADSGAPNRRGHRPVRPATVLRHRLGWGLVEMGLRLLAPLPSTDVVGRTPPPLLRAR